MLRRLRKGAARDVLSAVVKMRRICECCSGATKLLSSAQLECITRFREASFAAQYAFVATTMCRGACSPAERALLAAERIATSADSPFVDAMRLARQLVLGTRCGQSPKDLFLHHHFYDYQVLSSAPISIVDSVSCLAPVEAREREPQRCAVEDLYPSKEWFKAVRIATSWQHLLYSAMNSLKLYRKQLKGGDLRAANSVQRAIERMHEILDTYVIRTSDSHEIPLWEWRDCALDLCVEIPHPRRAHDKKQGRVTDTCSVRPLVVVPRAGPCF